MGQFSVFYILFLTLGILAVHNLFIRTLRIVKCITIFVHMAVAFLGTVEFMQNGI